MTPHTLAPSCPVRRALACVSGMSPAIITETLYALVVEQGFVPDEIHVVTTLDGREKVHRDLLNPQSGHFHAFVRDYLPGRTIRFNDDTIHLIGQDTDGTGTALADIQTDEDNRHAADTIYRVLRQLKAQAPTQLHASVAGGRKSMSFYMGQAFSLVAEPADRLSHVLVNEPFESVPDFFYPPSVPRLFVTRSGQRVSSAAARIQLAGLSVIKLGAMLGELPVAAQKDFDFAMRLAQATLEPPMVRLCFDKGRVEMLGRTIDMAPQEFLLLGLHALARLHETELVAGAAMRAEDLPERLLSDLNDGREVRGRDNFKPVHSKIVKRLRAEVGPVADWLTIESVRDRHSGIKHSPCELRLPARCLTLDGAEDWWRSLRKALGTIAR